MPERFLAYYRVSTARHGRSGLGLEAQKAEVARFLTEEEGELAGELVEVRSGKEEVGNRPPSSGGTCTVQEGGTTLVVAKLCHLVRNAAFVLTLMKDSKGRLRMASMPHSQG